MISHFYVIMALGIAFALVGALFRPGAVHDYEQGNYHPDRRLSAAILILVAEVCIVGGLALAIVAAIGVWHS